MKKILFVCTGNTCRSAMAAAICNYLANQLNADISADSCGLCVGGHPASQNAVLAVSELYNIDISNHISKGITPEIIENADVIFTMTMSHAAILASAFQKDADKICVAEPEISDPYLMPLPIYKECAQQLYSQIKSKFFCEE